jgi:small subunit ribosomal protein S13
MSVHGELMGKAKKKDKKSAKAAKKTEDKEEEAPSAETKKHAKKKAAPKEEEGVRGIVRLAGKDVMGGLTLARALLAVKGIGHTTRRSVARIVANELSVSPTAKVGTFSDAQIEKVDAILTNIHAYGMPGYLLNRQKDSETGKDVHHIMNDLVFSQRQDIEAHKDTYTWKGYRHAYGKRVRGQKTRNTGRKGMSLGVIRKALVPGTAGAAAPAAGAPAAAAAPKGKEAKKVGG